MTSISTLFPELRGHDFRFLALDVETANSFGGSICQIGLAGVTPAGEIVQSACYVDPEESFERFNTRLHGIDAAKVAGAPRFYDCLAALAPILGSRTVFQHSNFDRNAFAAAGRKYGLDLPLWDWRDSVQVARRAWPELKGNGGHGLASLKSHLGLRFLHHDAGEDARAAAMVVLRAEGHLQMEYAQILAPKAAVRKPKPQTYPGDPAGRLAGQVIVLGGELALSREAVLRLCHQAGLTVAPRVTLKTSYLVLPSSQEPPRAGLPRGMSWRRVGEVSGTGPAIRILNEADFLDLVAPPG